MTAVILNNSSAVIANYIGQWMWIIVIALCLGSIVIRDITLIIIIRVVFILTILCGSAAIYMAVYSNDPLSEAQKNLLDMANAGWKIGFTALSALISPKAARALGA